jgi:hypothetical protein
MISEDTRRFVLTSIPSIPYLEAILLFKRDRSAEWSAKRLGQALYIPESAASALVQALASAGVITGATDASLFHYSPRDATLDGALNALEEAYRADMIGVTRLVHDATQRSAQRLADAFRIRKDS